MEPVLTQSSGRDNTERSEREQVVFAQPSCDTGQPLARHSAPPFSVSCDGTGRLVHPDSVFHVEHYGAFCDCMPSW